MSNFPGLTEEIKKTVLFFIESDIKQYRRITEDTKQVAAVQNVSIPKKYKKYC